MALKERGRALLRDTVRWVLGTDDVGRYVRLRRLEAEKNIYRQKFSLSDLRSLLVGLGFERGRVVWVQSSWNQFYNFDGRPSDVIAVMRDLLGPTGTLAMPAFPIDQDPGKILEIDSVPSSTGILTEIFRRGRDVERSIHLSSSVCAAGPAAHFLVKDHHNDIFAWGPKTPYCRLVEADALFVGLGVAPLVRYLTPLHSVECLLYDEVPFFRDVFDGVVTYRWRRQSGEEGTHEFMKRIGRLSFRAYGRHFPAEMYTKIRLSNLDTHTVEARTVIAHALELGRRGITLYDKASVAHERRKARNPNFA